MPEFQIFSSIYAFASSVFYSKFQNQYEGLQWGRPGPGGVYWRESAVTGQKFFDKMVREINFNMKYLNMNKIIALFPGFHNRLFIFIGLELISRSKKA